jgi:plasmid stabilization system protein ParE
MIRIVYMARMRRELRLVVELIARDNPPAANTFVEEIEHLCSLLAVTPEMGPLRRKLAGTFVH